MNGSLLLDGGSLSYRYEAGAFGDPVVFLHPWFGCAAFWGRCVDALVSRPSYVLDLYSLGEGRSDYAGPEGIASAVLALLDAERLQRCALIGNSTGGIAAQIVAADAPDRVRTLVLVGTGASTVGVSTVFRAQLEAWLENPDDERTSSLVRRLFARDPPAEDLADKATFCCRSQNRRSIITSGSSTRP
jgi:pimeloyl-ACP methyl ester carboxylesterase